MKNRPLKNADDPDSVYTNDANDASYNQLGRLVTQARITGEISFSKIKDTTRPIIQYKGMKNVRDYITDEVNGFLKGYRRDLLQSQQNHIVVAVEKDTLRDTVASVTKKYTIPLFVCRGYPSTTAMYELYNNYRGSGKDKLVILVVSDLDPDGEQIAQTIINSMINNFSVPEDMVRGIKVALTREQAEKLSLPVNMIAKEKATRKKAYIEKYGDDTVWEADALPPEKLEEIVDKAIRQVLDIKAFNEEVRKEKEDAAELVSTRHAVLGFVKQHRTDKKYEFPKVKHLDHFYEELKSFESFIEDEIEDEDEDNNDDDSKTRWEKQLQESRKYLRTFGGFTNSDGDSFDEEEEPTNKDDDDKSKGKS
jgi:hypothetical protein